jgi:hypothetical protein
MAALPQTGRPPRAVVADGVDVAVEPVLAGGQLLRIADLAHGDVVRGGAGSGVR